MFCSSPKSDYTSLPSGVSLDGRIILRTPTPMSLEYEIAEEISPPKDPFLLLIVGPGRLAATPSRVRMSLAEEEWQVSPPRDPEVLAATGAGELATRPIRVREPLDSEYDDSSDGEDQIEGCDSGTSLEPIQMLHFHSELGEWRPGRPVASKALKESEERIINSDEGDDEGKKVQTKTPTKHEKPRWRVGVGFFRRKQLGSCTDDNGKERIQKRRAFLLPNRLIYFG